MRVSLFFALVLLAPGCQSSLIGADCLAPRIRCGRYCVDLNSDGLNCGTCGTACALGCAAGRCIQADAAPTPDVGRYDAGPPPRDVGIDAPMLDASSLDASLDAGLDASAPDGGPPRCDLGQLSCGTSCIDPRDATHCGDCTTSCSGTDVCASGTCAPDCGTLTACGTRCVDVARDGHHCGDCTTDCGVGRCVAGSCTSGGDGHLVLIGHDYETHRIEMSRVLANAVFLAAAASPRVLAYQASATATSIAGTNAAIAEAAAGRSYSIRSSGSAASVPVALESADVFLVYAQANASDAALRSVGYAWGLALSSFLARGGVIVVLEAPSLANVGTFQILRSAALFDATSESEVVTPRLVAVSGRESDAVIAGITFPYSGERHTVRFTTADPNAIVTTGSSPVVFHRVVTH